MELSLILIQKTVLFVTLTAHLVLALSSVLWFVRQTIFSTITQIAPATFHTASFALTKTLVLLASRTSISMTTTHLLWNYKRYLSTKLYELLWQSDLWYLQNWLLPESEWSHLQSLSQQLCFMLRLQYLLSCISNNSLLNGTCVPVDLTEILPVKVTCPQFCSACINSVCTQCIEGYFLSIPKECLTCPQNCVSCSNSTFCEHCNQVSSLNDGVAINSSKIWIRPWHLRPTVLQIVTNVAIHIPARSVRTNMLFQRKVSARSASLIVTNATIRIVVEFACQGILSIAMELVLLAQLIVKAASSNSC